jgi:outer membrane cobalamin receptor
MMLGRELIVGLAALAVAACAAASQGNQTGGRRSNVITADEIASISAVNAYEVVQRLRAQWLISRGIAGTRDPALEGAPSAGIVVYLDGVRRGGVESLREIPSEQIRELRWIDAKDATTRYGTGHIAGVIEVYTRR